MERGRKDRVRRSPINQELGEPIVPVVGVGRVPPSLGLCRRRLAVLELERLHQLEEVEHNLLVVGDLEPLDGECADPPI